MRFVSRSCCSVPPGVGLMLFSSGALTSLVGAAVLGHAHALQRRAQGLPRHAGRR